MCLLKKTFLTRVKRTKGYDMCGGLKKHRERSYVRKLTSNGYRSWIVVNWCEAGEHVVAKRSSGKELYYS